MEYNNTMRDLIVLGGHGGGQHPVNTPSANLHLTIAQRVGVATDKLNTGPIEELYGAASAKS